MSGQPKSIYDECMKGKQVKSTHKKIQGINITGPLDFLHVNLMGPMCIESKGRKRYALVVVDDFFKYSFVCFLREKSKTIEHLKSLCNRIQVETGHPIIMIRVIKRREFDNIDVNLFCNSKEIKQE